MKKSLYSLFVTAILSVTVISVRAADTPSEAIVLKVTGIAEATLPETGKTAIISSGDKLPQGTSINTGNAEVELQTMSGSKTTIKSGTKAQFSKLSLATENGEISKQTALIDLTIGTVVSSLDHTKKAINDYAIRTPRGVAAARGTEFTVTVAANGGVRVDVNSGIVRFTNSVTGQSLDVPSGFYIQIDADGKLFGPYEIPAPTPNVGTGQPGVLNPLIDVTTVSPSS